VIFDGTKILAVSRSKKKLMAGKLKLEQWQADRILVLKSYELSNRLIAKRMGLARTTVDNVVKKFKDGKH